MFINSVGHYLPERIIPNSYFLNVNGITDEWITSRTGIKERRRSAEDENVNTMGLAAVKNMMEKKPFPIEKVDLIVGATYSFYDTVGGIAHIVQKEYNIEDVIAVNVTAACCTLINSLEIVEGYFAAGKAERALVVASDQNTKYGFEDDEIAGHLWGDAGAALYITKERQSDDDIEIVDIKTRGHGNIGKGPEGVWVRPLDGGLRMPFGKDVFIHACNYMTNATKDIAEKNNVKIEDVTYLLPHQANSRIITNVADQLGVDHSNVITNVERLGNTGSPSTAIGLSENWEKFKKGDIIAIAVFGGGYSSGAALLRK